MKRKISLRFGSNLSIIVAIVFWSVSMYFVFNQNQATSKSTNLNEIPVNISQDLEFQNWMNVYMDSKKIGYTMHSYKKTEFGYIVKDYSLIKLPIGGTMKEIFMDSYAIFNDDFSLKNFTFGLVSDDYSTDMFGEIKNGKLLVKTYSGNSNSEISYDASNGIYLPSVIPMIVKAKNFPIGNFRLHSFDPFSMVINELDITIGEVEEVNTRYGKAKGNKITLSFSGISSEMWIDENGRIIREEEISGMYMTITDQEDALNIPVIEFAEKDLLDDLSVPCDREIPNPREASYLKVAIEGIEGEFFDLNDDFQKVVSLDQLIVEINSAMISGSKLVDSSKFLLSEPFIQSDDSRIIKTAKKIIGSETDTATKANLISEWVYKNIDKDFTVSIPSAVDVLRVKKGDCNEHTALYTGLARAVGIPTKVCLGIVYKDGVFYYHAWPAVYADKWIPIDPTFGQKLADATHIKLLEGGFERQTDLLRVVGKLKVKVLETSPAINL